MIRLITGTLLICLLLGCRTIPAESWPPDCSPETFGSALSLYQQWVSTGDSALLLEEMEALELRTGELNSTIRALHTPPHHKSEGTVPDEIAGRPHPIEMRAIICEYLHQRLRLEMELHCLQEQVGIVSGK
jgi:hypothetical protein